MSDDDGINIRLRTWANYQPPRPTVSFPCSPLDVARAILADATDDELRMSVPELVPLAEACVVLAADNAKLRAALREAATWIALTTQSESQHANYEDDPDWQMAQRLRKLADGT